MDLVLKKREIIEEISKIEDEKLVWAIARLLHLDDDVPELVEATEFAQDAIRGVIGGIRQPVLGKGGIEAALRRLARSLPVNEETKIDLHFGSVTANAVARLPTGSGPWP